MKSSNCTSLWKQKISFGKEPSGKFPVYVKPAFTVYNLNNDEEEHQTEISNIRFQQKRSSSFRVFDIADQSYSSNSWIRRPNGTKLQTSVILNSFCVWNIFFMMSYFYLYFANIYILEKWKKLCVPSKIAKTNWHMQTIVTDFCFILAKIVTFENHF